MPEYGNYKREIKDLKDLNKSTEVPNFITFDMFDTLFDIDMWDILTSFTNKMEKTTAQLEAQKNKLSAMVNEFKTYQEETEMQDMLIAWSGVIFDKTKLKNISLNHLTTVTFESANRCYTLELVDKKPCLSWTANARSKNVRPEDEHGAINFDSNHDCYYWLLKRYKKRG